MNNNLNPHEVDNKYIEQELLSVVLSRQKQNKSITLEDIVYVSPYKDAPEPILVLVADFLTANDLLVNPN